MRVRTLQEPGVVALGVKKNPVAYKNQKFLGSNAHLPLTHAGTKARDRVTKETEKKKNRRPPKGYTRTWNECINKRKAIKKSGTGGCRGSEESFPRVAAGGSVSECRGTKSRVRKWVDPRVSRPCILPGRTGNFTFTIDPERGVWDLSRRRLHTQTLSLPPSLLPSPTIS